MTTLTTLPVRLSPFPLRCHVQELIYGRRVRSLHHVPHAAAAGTVTGDDDVEKNKKRQASASGDLVPQIIDGYAYYIGLDTAALERNLTGLGYLP